VKNQSERRKRKNRGGKRIGKTLAPDLTEVGGRYKGEGSALRPMGGQRRGSEKGDREKGLNYERSIDGVRGLMKGHQRKRKDDGKEKIATGVSEGGRRGRN